MGSPHIIHGSETDNTPGPVYLKALLLGHWAGIESGWSSTDSAQASLFIFSLVKLVQPAQAEAKAKWVGSHSAPSFWGIFFRARVLT